MKATVETLLATLRLGPSDPDALRRAWTSIRTPGLCRLVEYETSELWLYRRLKVLDLMGVLPMEIEERLTARARDQAARNLMVDAQARATAQTLNELRIPHVLLKGSAMRRITDRVPYADARTTTDVDVLVPEGMQRRAWDGFLSCGYSLAFDRPVLEDGYELPGLARDLPTAVEIHRSVSRDLAPHLAWSRMGEGAAEIDFDGVRTRVPVPTELFWHALSHALKHGTHWFRLRSLLDGAALWASGEPIDWDVVRSRLASDEIPDRRGARLWLGAMRWLAGTEAEMTGLEPLPHAHLHRLLAWRIAVLRRSLSDRWTEKLMNESGRAEFGLPLTPLFGDASAPVKLRWRAASLLGRSAYRGWVLIPKG